VKCGSSGNTPAANTPVTLRIGLALPKTSDASSGVISFVGNQTSEQLVGVGWDGRPMPRLISGWKPSGDGRELKLTLTKDLHFHDGTPIDAAFVRDGLREFLKTSPLSYARHKSIVSIEADSVDTITIRLSRPEGLLLADLSNFLIAHPTDRTIGVGPYRLLPGKPMRLEKFDDYYRGRPAIDFVEVHEFEEQRSTWAALMRGEIDAVHDISSGAMDFVQAEGQTAVRTFPFTRPYFISLSFNTRHPVLKAPKVRQALSYAVDRPSIIKVAMNGQGSPAEGPIWPFHWAYSAAPKIYSRNVEAAALGLESAGLPMKKAAEQGHMPSRFRFRCLTVPRFERIALTLQKQLSEVGVDLEVQTVSLQDLVGRAQTGDYDSLLMEWTSGRSLVWTYSFFHSSARSLGYTSADAPLDRIRSASGDADTRAAVSDFQQVLFDDPPAIFLAWPQVARVVSSRFVVPDDHVIPGIRTTDQATTPGRDIISSLWQWKAASAPGPGQ
jgi:peptide/nickel transport system substrate-binding protein